MVKNSDPGSGINIQDPQHLPFLRMTFGELADDEYQSDMGATRGNIGKGGIGGGIRMAQASICFLHKLRFILLTVPKRI